MQSFESLAKAISAVHDEALFDSDWDFGLEALAEQELLSCLAHLKLAQVAAMKAHYIMVRARAQSPHRL